MSILRKQQNSEITPNQEHIQEIDQDQGAESELSEEDLEKRRKNKDLKKQKDWKEFLSFLKSNPQTMMSLIPASPMAISSLKNYQQKNLMKGASSQSFYDASSIGSFNLN